MPTAAASRALPAPLPGTGRRAVLAALLLVVCSGARAQSSGLLPPPPRLPVDDTPSQHACTLAMLRRDEPCTYEVEAPRQAPSRVRERENQKAAGAFAAACPSAALAPDALKPDPRLVKKCESDLAEVALTLCGYDGEFAVTDAGGRWAIEARDCAEGLQRVLAHIRTEASTAEPPSEPPATPRRRRTQLPLQRG